MRLSSGVQRAIGLLVLLSGLAGSVVGQAPNARQEYSAAAGKSPGAERISALESFLSAHPETQLKRDALELIAWDSRSAAKLPDLEYWTEQLLKRWPDNPLAAAIIVENSLPITGPGADGRSASPIEIAKRGLQKFDRLDRPEGMSHEEFSEVRDFITATLNGVVGYSYFEQKDLSQARTYLRKAVAVVPNNAQYTYTLAICDLDGPDPDQAEGYRMLARSVNLTRGTAAGASLAQYAAQRFQHAGGTSADWDKYIAATAVPAPTGSQGEPPSVAANAGFPSINPNSSSTPSAAKRNPPSPVSPAQPAANSPASSTPSSAPSAVAAAQPAPAANAPAPFFKPRARPIFPPNTPVSVGVLIQAGLTNQQERRPIVYSLSDMVVHLRGKDEAFVMSFGRGIMFEEDLTSNSKALEQAMDSISPDAGAALYDAVTFAAGHLNRIARNANRVLLVVAGEGDRNSSVSPLELSGEVNLSGVRIFCIGVGVVDPNDQARLRQLASMSGGKARFIADTSQFRSAVHAFAQDFGVSFPQ